MRIRHDHLRLHWSGFAGSKIVKPYSRTTHDLIQVIISLFPVFIPVLFEGAAGNMWVLITVSINFLRYMGKSLHKVAIYRQRTINQEVL